MPELTCDYLVVGAGVDIVTPHSKSGVYLPYAIWPGMGKDHDLTP